MSNLVESPFARSTAVVETAGARQDQSRELAETQVKYLMAQQFPRDEIANMDKILNAFTRPTLAEQSQYQFSRGGTDINGPSIRAAEAMAQKWGNMDQGFRERSRGVGPDGVPYSEVEAFCVDLESRTSKRLQFIVRHWRDTKKGGYKLTDERDIYELCANQAQRRVRACILSQIPGDVIEAAMQQANATLHAKADTSPEAMDKMLAAFEPFGITKEHIEKRIQRRLDAIQPAQVVTLKRIYASLRDGMSSPSEWFEIEESSPVGNATTISDITRKAAEKKASAKPAKQSASDDGFEQSAPAHDGTGMALTYQQVFDKITKADAPDVLDMAADLINAVADANERVKLAAYYEERRAALGGA